MAPPEPGQPRFAMLEVPDWLWGNDPAKFFTSAGLRYRRNKTGSWSLQTDESYSKGSADLVRFGALVDGVDFSALSRDAGASSEDTLLSGHDRSQVLREMAGRIDIDNPITYFRLCQASVALAGSEDVAFAVKDALGGIQSMTFREGGDEFAFPNAAAYLLTRSEKIVHRQKIPSVWLRIEQDDVLARGDTGHLTSRESLAFRASSELSSGALLLDVYLGPLMACLTPYIWAIPIYHTYGTIVILLGRPVVGLANDVVEGLHLAPTSAARASIPPPQVRPGGYNSALRWWGSALNSLFSVTTNPVVFTMQDGTYNPSKHLQGLLTIEQMFKRTSSLLTNYRDPEVTRVLFFTVMDTLERLTGKSLDDMCNLDKATKMLTSLEERLPAEAAEVLLGAARRGVRALDVLQTGFFMRSGAQVRLRVDGELNTQPLAVATARYLKVLRNATHGHGSNRSSNEALTSALLAHHTGQIPHDLPLLAFAYVLDVLTRPQVLARRFYSNGR